MMRSRFWPRLTFANVTSLLALFVALGGSAAAAIVVSSNSQVAKDTISGHHPPTGDHANIIAGSVDAQDLARGAVTPASLGAVAKFRRKGTGPATAVRVLSLGGLRVNYSCNFDGSSYDPTLIARTSVDHASITEAFTTGTDGFGSAFVDRNDDFSPGSALNLSENRVFGEGTLVYSTPSGTVVTLNFGFDDGTACLVHGVAIER